MSNFKLKKIESYINSEIKSLEKKILKNIDGNKKTVAFVSYNQSYRNQVGNLHRRFKEAEFNVINIVGFTINDRFEKEAETYVVPKIIHTEYGKIYPKVNFKFIDIIISPDKEFITSEIYDECFISKRAKKIYLTHDVLGGGVHDFFDFTIMPSKNAIDNVKNNKFRKGHCLIPGGYPKLDYSIEKYKEAQDNSNLVEDSIIYAPTKRAIVEEFSLLSSVCGLGFDATMLELLNKNFTENIIFRPHPHNVNYKNLDNSHFSSLLISKIFKNNKKIFLNYSQSYLEYYIRSKFMITDFSDTAFTYSFTTLKPSVFFDPFKILKNTEKVGKTVKTMSELIEAGKEFLKNKSIYKEKIEDFRNNAVANIGKSSEYLINNIDYILNDKKHPDWHYF